jgi:hypothetical protein
MSSYFDEIDRQIGQASRLEFPTSVETLRKIEETLVFDVSVCIMMPGFPEELRNAANAIILEHGVEVRPCNSPDNPRVEEQSEYFKEIGYLSFELHSIFHRVVNEWEVPGRFSEEGLNFSDNPIYPLRQLATRAEALREELVEKRKGSGGNE